MKLRELVNKFVLHKRYGGKFFDNEFYKKTYSPLLSPHIDFLLSNPQDYKKPNPWFDPVYYLNINSDVRESKMEPFIHFVKHGYYEMRRVAANTNLTDIFKWTFQQEKVQLEKPTITPMSSVKKLEKQLELEVLCVCGEKQVEFIKSVTAKSFQDCGLNIKINLYIYDKTITKLENYKVLPNVEVVVHKSIGNIGFGSAINFLFKEINPQNYFLVINPDSFPKPGCISNLVNRIIGNEVGIVEARQWPNQHPKESNQQTGETPWASGAFFMIRSDLFEHIEGFDEIFFLYTEDVDLSWKTWLSGLKVVEEREALCEHHTGICWYANDIVYGETFYSARNFIVLLKKYFGEEGKKMGISVVKRLPWPNKLKNEVLESYSTVDEKVKVINWNFDHPMIKVFGYNQYHEFYKNN